MKVLIIGGGASGMMAALSALENPNNTVTLLERQSRVGKKLLATGVCAFRAGELLCGTDACVF